MKKKRRIKLYQIKLIGHNFKFNKTIIGFKSYWRVCRCSSQVYYYFLLFLIIYIQIQIRIWEIRFYAYSFQLPSYWHICFLPILPFCSTILKLAMFNSFTADKEHICNAHISWKKYEYLVVTAILENKRVFSNHF